ncbi:MAG: signal peptide peptidase SppA [Deltaproteobacteria bacterium]
MAKRLFRQEHPVLLGFFILGCIFVLFWGGITFFIATISKPRTQFFSKRNGVGVVELVGPIISSEKTLAVLKDFRKDSSVKAIVLRIDSPGGAVGASQEIFEDVKHTAAEKPVVASMGSIAASGGFYAAIGANKIFANPGTLTGSIGVILKFANLQELFNKIGYKSEVIKSGALKDVGSPDRPLTEAEKKLLQDLIDNVFQQFVQAVATQRNIPVEKVLPIADGRVLSGAQAKELGLIDSFGNFTDAVAAAAKLGGLKDKEPELIYPEENTFSLSRLLSGEASTWLQNLMPRRVPFLSYEWTTTH